MRYPIGIQDFENIRRGDYVYVDKTEYIYKLFKGSGNYCLLYRPRRFGKSLLVSTMEAYFSGRKELFDGLAIAELEKDWVQYPVLRFDMTGISYSTPDAVNIAISYQLSRLAQRYEVPVTDKPIDSRFESLIDDVHAKTGLPVVILIDEYDKSIVDNLDNDTLADTFRNQLQGFYSVMKAKDAYIKFGFLTGITKIGKLSVFSGMNNLKDISLDIRYADICGISDEELKKFFGESVKELARTNDISEQDFYERLAQKYDGYHFCENSDGMYNPFNILKIFESHQFRSYWFETGTPSLLVRLLMNEHYALDEIPGIEVPPSMLSGVNVSWPNAITLLYQTGYLTISGYDKEMDLYTLDYPNKEVENGFIESLSEFYTPIQQKSGMFSINFFYEDIQNGDVMSLMRRLTGLFSNMDFPIHEEAELYFQNTMYVILKLMGQMVQVERHTSNGRIDVLIQTDKYVYIIELKRDQNPDDALDQIEQKGYDWPFQADGRKVFKIGANFSTRNRRLEGWKVEE